jgi:hypothetical protein
MNPVGLARRPFCQAEEIRQQTTRVIRKGFSFFALYRFGGRNNVEKRGTERKT